VRPEGFGKLNKFTHLIGSWTGVLPACSAVPYHLAYRLPRLNHLSYRALPTSPTAYRLPRLTHLPYHRLRRLNPLAYRLPRLNHLAYRLPRLTHLTYRLPRLTHLAYRALIT
jgi:hypothetical protein